MTDTRTNSPALTSNEVKVRLFPGWWTHIGAIGNDRPFYRVLVHDDAELELAKSLKPSCVRAEYTLLGPKRRWNR